MLIFIALAMSVVSQPPLVLDFDAATPEESLRMMEVEGAGKLSLASLAHTPDRSGGFARLQVGKGEKSATARVKYDDIAEVKVGVKVRVEPPADVAKEELGTHRGGVVVRHAGERSLRVTVTAGDEVQLIAAGGREERVLARSPLQSKGAEDWHTIEVTGVGMRVRVKADGAEVIDVLEPAVMGAGHVEVFAATRGAVAFDDLTVTQLPPPLTAVLQVQGMMCELCEAKVEGAVKAIKGVKDAKASNTLGVCFVELDVDHPAEVAELVKAIEGKKYKVTLEGA